MKKNMVGKGISFAKRIYPPRTIGLAIGMFSVMAAIAPIGLPGWVWILLFFNGLAWPHLAYQLSTHTREPYQAERRNLLYDSLLGGFWAATMHFNPLPTVTILSMMTMNNIAAGGQRLLVQGVLVQVAGMIVSIALFGPGLVLVTTDLQLYACLPMLTLYPLALGGVCYRLAIKLSEHKQKLSVLSRTDGLTGLHNHGSLKDLLHLHFHTCRRERSEAVIALIDVDHFKQINDTYGHTVGDSVLCKISAELKKNLREGDLAGRYGGDEFCVILLNTSLSKACEVTERLRQVMGSFRNEQLPGLQVSLSVGLAPYRSEMVAPCEWFDEADKALYTAKNNGRNKVNFSPEYITIIT